MRYYCQDKATREIRQIKKRDAENLVGRHTFAPIVLLSKSKKTEKIETPFAFFWVEK